MTGSTLAEEGMLSSLFKKDMEKLGYPKGYLAGLISCAGLIGALIPPSNVLLILGLSGQMSILRLWIAGILPGILLALGLMLVAALIQNRYETIESVSFVSQDKTLSKKRNSLLLDKLKKSKKARQQILLLKQDISKPDFGREN